MPGPVLFGLQREFDVVVMRQRRLHPVGLVTDDDDQPLRSGVACGVQYIVDQHSSADFVQHFGYVGIHPPALAGSEDDGKRSGHGKAGGWRLEAEGRRQWPFRSNENDSGVAGMPEAGLQIGENRTRRMGVVVIDCQNGKNGATACGGHIKYPTQPRHCLSAGSSAERHGDPDFRRPSSGTEIRDYTQTVTRYRLHFSFGETTV